MNATEIENIGESTRIDIHKYQCERCVFNSSYMDELLMHVNTKHRADDVDDAERSSNYPNVTHQREQKLMITVYTSITAQEDFFCIT